MLSARWFNFSYPKLWCFSQSGCQWCILQVQAQDMYLLLGSPLLPLSIWYCTVWSYWLQVIIIWCVSCLYAFKMHLFAYGWCLHTLPVVFQDKGEDSVTPFELLWTLQLKHSRVVFSNPMYFAIFLHWISSAQWQKFESTVQLVGFVFGSLLCTTGASNFQEPENLLLFSLWLSSVCCRGED